MATAGNRIGNFNDSVSDPIINPDFAYPDKNIRFLDAQRQLDQLKGIVPPSAANEISPYKLQRGYIRNIQPATLNYVQEYKCNFQFNPQEIRQQVSMREDIYNPVLLTAEQLSQPIGGTVNFQFDLLFDRSMEMAEDWDRGYLITDSENGAESTSGRYAAAKFGVYADLKMLYQAIGQGISESLIEQQLNNLRSTYEAKFKRENAYSEPSADSETEDEDSDTSAASSGSGIFNDDFDVTAVASLLETNLGNSAFLIPNPVRIVLSELFMVDGYVTGTSVDFLKFNNLMVPMQCRVALSVNAMYIGFAKNKTFVTTTMETGRQVAAEELASSTEAAAEIEKALLYVNPFVLALESMVDINNVYDQTSGWPRTDWDRATNGNLINGQLFYFLIPEEYINSDEIRRYAYSGFKSIYPNKAEGQDDDRVLSAFEDLNRAPFSISYICGMQVFGKLNQNSFNGVGWTQAEAEAMLKDDPNGKPKYKDSAQADVVAYYEVTKSAASKQEWGSGSSDTEGGTASACRRTTTKNIQNGGATKLNTKSFPTAIRNSYYVVVWDLKIVLSTGSVSYTYTPSPAWTAKVRNGSMGTGVQNAVSITSYSRGGGT